MQTESVAFLTFLKKRSSQTSKKLPTKMLKRHSINHEQCGKDVSMSVIHYSV